MLLEVLGGNMRPEFLPGGIQGQARAMMRSKWSSGVEVSDDLAVVCRRILMVRESN